MACRQKNVHFWYFQALYNQFCLLTYNFYQRKLKAITRKMYAIHFLIRPLDSFLEIHEDESDFHRPQKKNLEAASKNEGHTSSA